MPKTGDLCESYRISPRQDPTVPAIMSEIAEVGPIASWRDDPRSGVTYAAKHITVNADLRRQPGKARVG